MWFTSTILALSLTAAHAARSSAVDTQHAQRALLAAEFPLLTAGGPEAAAASMRRLQFLREQKKRPAVEPVEQEEEESPEEIEDIVQCTTHTTEVEVEIEDNGDIHAEAISKAMKLACTEGSEVTMQMFEEIFLQEDAFAFAHATAFAMISCESNDEDAYHCASVTASATAYAEATAEAHASAVSTAVSSCGCMTDAVSVAVASSTIYVDLIAEATATATASVCIDGIGKVSSYAYDSCSSLVYGKVFARAVSEAIVKGDCMNSEAISRVLTEAGADFNAYSTCGMTAEAIIKE